MIASLVKQCYLQTHHLTSEGNESCIATLWNIPLEFGDEVGVKPKGPHCGKQACQRSCGN